MGVTWDFWILVGVVLLLLVGMGQSLGRLKKLEAEVRKAGELLSDLRRREVDLDSLRDSLRQPIRNFLNLEADFKAVLKYLGVVFVHSEDKEFGGGLPVVTVVSSDSFFSASKGRRFLVRDPGRVSAEEAAKGTPFPLMGSCGERPVDPEHTGEEDAR